MLTVLRIWTAVVAVLVVVAETRANVTVYHGKPLPILLPYYVMAAWLLTGALFPRWGPRLLVSAWGVTLGHTYGVLMENLAFRQPPAFFVAALTRLIVSSVICLGLAIYLSRIATRDARVTASEDRPTRALLRTLAVAFAVFVLSAQVLTTWGEGKPLTMLAPYYVIAVALAGTAFYFDRIPLSALAAWSVAFGYFYFEYAGFLVFFERPAWVLGLAATAVLTSLVGLVAQSIYVMRRAIAPAASVTAVAS